MGDVFIVERAHEMSFYTAAGTLLVRRGSDGAFVDPIGRPLACSIFERPAPKVTSITPDLVGTGAIAMELVVHGSSFAPQSVVQLQGRIIETMFVDDSTLRTTIPAAALARPGTVRIVVMTPAPGGGGSSAATLTVTALH